LYVHKCFYKMKKLVYLFFLIFSVITIAQPNWIASDTLALVEDKFQELFYESLKQKGIENYDRAINLLQQATQLNSKNATIYHEIGRNYLFQENYAQAEEYIHKAIQKDNQNKWFYISLYDVYYQTKNYHKSIEVVQKLINFNDNRKLEFQDDLVSLYMYTQQFDKALTLIEQLEKSAPFDQNREMYKQQILIDKTESMSISELEREIQKNPKNEQVYITLIYQYWENNNTEKSFEIAKLLAKNIPESDWAHVSLFKFYLEENNVEQATKSMNKVFDSKQIDNKIKHRILNEFLIFVNQNPQYHKDLKKIIIYFKKDPSINVPKEIAKFFYAKQKWQNASDYFEISLQDNPNDMETVFLLLETYMEQKDFAKISQISQNFIDLFPLQPELYYYNGLSQNQIQNHKKAKNILEEGLDYLIDNQALELNFYKQLLQTNQALGNQKEIEKYQGKIENLTKSNK